MTQCKFVYFIRPVGHEGPIKIGCSGVPSGRLLSLMAWSPIDLEIIAQVPGDFAMEHQVHCRFARDHLRHEWFRATPSLLAFISTVQATGKLDAIHDLPVTGSLRGAASGRQWSAERRAYMSYCLRINGAERRLRKQGAGVGWCCPKDVDGIMARWDGHGRGVSPVQPTPADMARLDEYLASPAEHSILPEREVAA